MAFLFWRALPLAACAAVAASLGIRSSDVALGDDVAGANATADWPHIFQRHKEAVKDVREQRDDVNLVAADKQSSKLSESFQVLATMLPKGATKDVFKRLRVCASCDELRRLGGTTGGGYLTCMDGLGPHARAAYTMGVEPLERWSKDVYSMLSTPVHQFDCTVEGPPENCKDCHFHKVCMSGTNGGGAHPVGPNMNLQQIIESTGQAAAPDDSLLMKMSLEANGVEWLIFADEKPNLRQFKQLIIQFHSLHKYTYHQTYARALRNIEEAGFKVASMRGDSDRGMFEVAGITVPQTIEVAFIKNNPSLEACEA